MYRLFPTGFRIIKLAALTVALAGLLVGLSGTGRVLAADIPSPTELPGPAYSIRLDEKPFQLNFLAFQDKQGPLMLSLSDCRRVFGMNMNIDDSGVLLLEDNQHRMLLPASNYLKYSSWSVLNGPAGESIRLDIIYVPLEPIAQEWRYQINSSTEQNAVLLYSPGYETAAESAEGLLPDAWPTWGSFAAVPAMNSVWPDEAIVGGYFTAITNSSDNRINNIIRSCASINGQALAPGALFSFNRTVGQRTAQRGYRLAPVYSGKKVVSGLGGGICQTSTTLYNAARESGMRVVERHHHSLPVHYVASGNDATVSWGTADFRFRNSRDYPVKLLAQVYKNYVIIALARAD